MSKKFTLDVSHVAKLANLPLSPDELPKYEEELQAILDLVNKLQKIDTHAVEPTSQVTGLTNVLRQDEVKSSLTQEEALANAPRSHNGYFVVKAIFD